MPSLKELNQSPSSLKINEKRRVGIVVSDPNRNRQMGMNALIL